MPPSVDDAWKQLRRRRAQECMTFIIAHQSACEKTAAAEADPSALRDKARDLLQAWLLRQNGLHSEFSAQCLKQTVDRFVDFTFRSEIRKIPFKKN